MDASCNVDWVAGGDGLVSEKEKILLTEEQETLLIPLYCKAQEGNPLFGDEKG